VLSCLRLVRLGNVMIIVFSVEVFVVRCIFTIVEGICSTVDPLLLILILHVETLICDILALTLQVLSNG
jgi:hypothetical protein